MSHTGFDGQFHDDDDEPFDIEVDVIDAITETGMSLATRSAIIDVGKFMSMSPADLDSLRSAMVYDALKELSDRRLAPVSLPSVRMKHIPGKDGQPVLCEMHVTIFALRKLWMDEEAADALELAISRRAMDEAREDGSGSETY